MTTRSRTRPILVFVLVVSASIAMQAGSPPEPRSTSLAKQLGQLLSERHLDAIAAPAEDGHGRFVAAMFVPGVQLLVVAAQYPSPDYLHWLIGQKQYREAYVGLQQAAVPDGQVFFQDLGCDGLLVGEQDSVDVMYEHGTTQTLFDGQWKKKKMSEEAYLAKVRDADATYSALLTTLIEALQAQPRSQL